METSAVSLPENPTSEDLREFDSVMDSWQDSVEHYVSILAKELSIELSQAYDVWFFRSRGRWTQEKENLLIKCFHKGEKIDIFNDKRF